MSVQFLVGFMTIFFACFDVESFFRCCFIWLNMFLGIAICSNTEICVACDVYLMLLVILYLFLSQMHFNLYYFCSVLISHECNLLAMVKDVGDSQSDQSEPGYISFCIQLGVLSNNSIIIINKSICCSVLCLIKYAISYWIKLINFVFLMVLRNSLKYIVLLFCVIPAFGVIDVQTTG